MTQQAAVQSQRKRKTKFQEIYTLFFILFYLFIII